MAYQLIVVKPIAVSMWTEPNRQPGDVVWVNTMEAARHLLEAGLVRWPEGETPREVQGEVVPQERKSFGDRTGGPSTASLSLSARGPERSLSASAAALVPPHRR